VITLQVRTEAKEVERLLGLLLGLLRSSPRAAELAEALDESPDSPADLFEVDAHTAPTGELVVAFQPTERLRRLVAAFGAGDGHGLGVDCGGVDGDRSADFHRGGAS
jgi:hypothetical protein